VSLTPAEEAELRFQLGRLLGTMNEVGASRAELERAVAGLPPGSLQAVRAMTLLGWLQGGRLPGARAPAVAAPRRGCGGLCPACGAAAAARGPGHRAAAARRGGRVG
jgi:hypothetical protein